ncbi:MAG TPA: hypothetical protein VG816_14585 [Solirubrobacterales bacterium]|nr:hypothetical protein [Solirubrobacterales bacterium]
MRRILAGTVCVLVLSGMLASTAGASFGFKSGKEGFSVAVKAEDGKPSSKAGSHPGEWSMHLGLNQAGGFPDGDLRDLKIETPQGMLLNPTFQGSVASELVKCSLVDFQTPRVSPYEQSLSGESCPLYAQVGTIEVHSSFGGGVTRRFGLFNLKAPPGLPAQLGASPFGSPIVFDVGLAPNSSGRYQLSLEATDFSQALDVSGIDFNFWGVPWATNHDPERGICLNETDPSAYYGELHKIEIIEKEGKKTEKFVPATCGVGPPGEYPPKAFLTLPTECSASLSFTATANSWQAPAKVSATAINDDTLGQPEKISNCSSLPFTPEPLGLLNTTNASTSSGYDFRLTADQEGLVQPNQPVPSAARKVVVHLPQGVTVNPSVGAGLIGCSPSQYAAETPFNGQGHGCPNGSKIGDFIVQTPLFENVAGHEFFDGAIYLAQPRDNPSGSLVGVYLVAKLRQRGVMIRLAGKIDPNPTDGTITATFEGLPELPYTDLRMNFRAGQRAFLISPPSCGEAITHTEMTPWSNETTISGTPTSSDITSGVEYGPCPWGTPPFDVEATTGGINSNVNSYTPYYVHLTRHDTDQEITSYSLVLPKGITGKLAGVPYCPEADIAAARNNTGFNEEAHPSCPAASQVGRTVTGYGVGPALTYASGRIYLAGPYHGAPLSLVTVNSATVGPFDLGTIVIRSAFQVDPHTAQLWIDSSASDPIPHIIDGIPLHLREVRIYVDRPNFTHNPSSCEPSSLESTLTGSGASFESSSDDSKVTISRHFQLLNCSTLGFKPKLGIRLRGNFHRGGYPQLRATFAARGPQDSNLRRIEVEMPHAEFLAQNHIREVCSRVQFDAKRCPSGSVYGSAVAYTPLLDDPLRGNVYLRSSTGKLPDLVADLYSGAVRIVVEGHIGPTKQGGVDAFFDELPDQPLERFVMTLRGGKHGLLTNSTNICAAPPFASVSSIAQNNIGAKFDTVLRGTCKGKKKPKAKQGKGKGSKGTGHKKGHK